MHYEFANSLQNRILYKMRINLKQIKETPERQSGVEGRHREYGTRHRGEG